MAFIADSKIEVRFTVYRYEYGYDEIKEIFPATAEGLVQAQKLACELQDSMKKKQGHDRYVGDGFIYDFEGIIRVDTLHDEVEHILS